ncbi:MAG: hypothetical protein ACI8UP_003255 [Porticoccaceae bacterium]|jgi:hypothetical protein
MNNEQQAFLEKLASRIPQLFEVIRQGNIKSEYIIGIRRIGQRHVRLKIVAEVVVAGANPLASHSAMSSVDVSAQNNLVRGVAAGGNEIEPASRRRQSRKR